MLTVILDNIRSAYNVGAIMRTMDAVGGGNLIACGITPYPEIDGDTRSPVVITANTKQIAKTALGAEQHLQITHSPSVPSSIHQEATLLALEQSDESINLFDYEPPSGPIALILGDEVNGIAPDTLAKADAVLQIPQQGTKESLNVSVAAGIALYHLRPPRP